MTNGITGVDRTTVDQLVIDPCLNGAVALHNPGVAETIGATTRGLEDSTITDIHHTGIGHSVFDIEHSCSNINRAGGGIVEADSGVNISERIVLLIVSAVVVERARTMHPIVEGVGVGKGAIIVEGAVTEEDLIFVGTSVTAPRCIIRVHYASAGDALDEVAAHVQGAIKRSGCRASDGAVGPVGGAINRSGRPG